MSNLPISVVIKQARNKDQTKEEEDEDDPQPKRSRHENYKLAKELEEARKLGNAPAAVDESGKDINPHIPQYISRVPFFYNTDQPTLRHQRSLNSSKEPVPLDTGVERGIRVKRADKWRPGACENCGAMGHKRKDCLERRRKVGARWTNKNIAPDDVAKTDIKHTWDSKRDRWAGWRPEMYDDTIKEYEKVEETRRKLKEETLKEEASRIEESSQDASPTREGDVALNDSDDDDSDDDEKYADKADMPGTKVDSKQRITVRNLRLREDTAKYLLNLDPESAYYDPKTRSMRENPLPGSSKGPTEFIGENFVRYTGDVDRVNRAQVFAWQAAEKGVDVHLQALPTKTELVQKEFESKKEEYNEKIEKYITEKYGDPWKLAKPASDLQVSQNDTYVEYTRDGKITKVRGPQLP